MTFAFAFLLLSFPLPARDSLATRLAAADFCTVTVERAAARVDCVDRDGGTILTERWSPDERGFTARLTTAQFRLLGRDSNPSRFYFQR